MKIEIGNFYCKLKLKATDKYRMGKKDPIKILRKHFRVRPLNYNRITSVKEHTWSGWKYYVTPKGQFMTGFLPEVLEVLKANGIPVEGAVDLRTNHAITPRNLDLSDIVRDYQLTAIDSFLENELQVGRHTVPFIRGIFDMATNAGKSYACLGLVMLLRWHRVTIVVTSIEVFKAMSAALKTQNLDFGVVNAAKKQKGKRLTLCMKDSLINYITTSVNALAYFANSNVLIGDEIHHAGAKNYKWLFRQLKVANVLGMSGTPLDNKDNAKNRQIMGLTGKPIAHISSKALIKAGHSDDIRVLFIEVPPADVYAISYEDTLERNYFYSKYIWDEIVRIIVEDVDGQVLITFTKTAHGQDLVKFLNEHPKLKHLKGKIKAVWGKDPRREEKLQDFLDCKVTILAASMLIQEGGNYPDIKYQIQYFGGDSKIRTDQTTGRGSRKSNIDQDQPLRLYEFKPMDGTYCQSHATARMGFYRAKKYKLKIRRIKAK